MARGGRRKEVAPHGMGVCPYIKHPPLSTRQKIILDNHAIMTYLVHVGTASIWRTYTLGVPMAAWDVFLANYDVTLNETSALESCGLPLTDLESWNKLPEFKAAKKAILKRHYDNLISSILLNPKSSAEKKTARELYEKMLAEKTSSVMANKKADKINARMGLPE